MFGWLLLAIPVGVALCKKPRVLIAAVAVGTALVITRWSLITDESLLWQAMTGTTVVAFIYITAGALAGAAIGRVMVRTMGGRHQA